MSVATFRIPIYTGIVPNILVVAVPKTMSYCLHQLILLLRSGNPSATHGESCKSGLFEGVVDDFGCWRVQIGFDRLKAIPPTDLHDDTGIHLAIN